MNYYWFNRQEILQKAKERYSKEILILLWKWKKIKDYPQVYVEECKYKIKKIQISRFIKTELESDSDSDLDSESDSEAGSGYDTVH